MRKILYWVFILAVLTSCKSTKHLFTPQTSSSYLSSKVQLTISGKGGSEVNIGGSMKLKSRERMQVSILMPVLRSEVVRIDVTPDEILIVDRLNKRYVRSGREELKKYLPKNAQFSRLEKILFDASLPNGKSEITAKELGIPGLQKAKVRLYNFSTQEFSMVPTEISSRYTQVPVEVLITMLEDLL